MPHQKLTEIKIQCSALKGVKAIGIWSILKRSKMKFSALYSKLHSSPSRGVKINLMIKNKI